MFPLSYRLLALDRRLHAEIGNELDRRDPRPWRLLRLRLLRLSVRARLAGAMRRATVTATA